MSTDKMLPDDRAQIFARSALGPDTFDSGDGAMSPVRSDYYGNLFVQLVGPTPAGPVVYVTIDTWGLDDADPATINALASLSLMYSYDPVDELAHRVTGGTPFDATIADLGQYALDARGFQFVINPGTGEWEPMQQPGGSVGVDPVTDGSGAIAVAATSQVAFAANAGRTFLMIQNPSTETEPLYYDFGAAATIDASSMELLPGQAALFDSRVPTTSVTVIATTMGHKFFAKEG